MNPTAHALEHKYVHMQQHIHVLHVTYGIDDKTATKELMEVHKDHINDFSVGR